MSAGDPIYPFLEDQTKSDRFWKISTPSKYETIASDIGKLVDVKQAAYGDSFGKAGEVLKILYPNGISHEQMDDVLTIARVLDKLFRVATDKDALGESPWSDVAGYALLAIARGKK